MMQSKELTDVTLVSDDKIHFQTHKVVLSACSKVFKGIMESFSQHNSVIYLRGVLHDDLESILEFMYLGKVSLSEDKLNNFLEVAKSLEIKGISNCVSLTDTVTSEELLDVSIKPEVSSSQKDDIIQDGTSIKMLEPFDEKVQSDAKVSKEVTKPIYDKIDEPQKKETDSKPLTTSYEPHPDGMWYCDVCNNKYTRKVGLERHFQSTHEGMKYACNKCDFQARDKRYLTIHFQSVHEGLKYACDMCDYQASLKESLRTHFKSMHEGIRFPCNKCDYLATFKSSLRTHNMYKHKKEMIKNVMYDCNLCENKFTRQRKLKSHIQLIHNGKKHPCDQCGFQSKNKSYLNKHIQSRHGNTS